MENAAMKKEHDSEYVLHDVLDEIFRYLDIMALRNVAFVSRLWNHFAKKEISKQARGPLSRVLLPVLNVSEELQFKLEDYVGTKTNAMLMFCALGLSTVLMLEHKREF